MPKKPLGSECWYSLNRDSISWLRTLRKRKQPIVSVCHPGLERYRSDSRFYIRIMTNIGVGTLLIAKDIVTCKKRYWVLGSGTLTLTLPRPLVITCSSIVR